MESLLNYFDPKQPASFSGASTSAKNQQTSKQQLAIGCRARTVTRYTCPSEKIFSRRKTIVPGSNQQIQADLIDLAL